MLVKTILLLMVEDWENLVIETGVDSLLNYLAENGEASIGEVCEEIGVEEARVKEWADALEEENLIEKHHTIRSGLILEFNKKNIEETERKKQEIEMDLDEESEEIKEKLDEGSNIMAEKRSQLLEKKEDLEEDEKEVVVEDTVVRLENLEDQINEQLDEDDLDHDTLRLIEEVEDVLGEVEVLVKRQLTPEQGEKLDEKAEDTVSEVREVLDMAKDRDDFVEDEQEVRKHLKAVEKLEKNIEKAKKRESREKTSGGGLFNKVKSLMPVRKSSGKNKKAEPSEPESGGDKENSRSEEGSESFEPVDIKIRPEDKIKKKDFPEQTYQELVDENRVTEVMRKISLIKKPNYEGLMKAERHNRNRNDLVSYLEERVKDVRE